MLADFKKKFSVTFKIIPKWTKMPQKLVTTLSLKLFMLRLDSSLVRTQPLSILQVFDPNQ